MDIPFVNVDYIYPTSGSMIDGDGIIYHREYMGAFYQYECGKSFLDICVEMGLKSNNIEISL